MASSPLAFPAVFNRTTAAPVVGFYEWQDPAAPGVRYLVDSAAQGDLNVFKLEYSAPSSGLPPTWSLGSAFVPAGAQPVAVNHQW